MRPSTDPVGSGVDGPVNVDLNGLGLSSPVVVASGVLPMDGEVWSSMEGVGLICTKGITLEPRAGNRGERLVETPSGLLNSIGLENPGIDRFLEAILPDLLRSRRSLGLNVAFSSLGELEELIGRIGDRAASVEVLELNLSCPNVDREGAVWGESPERTFEAVRLARSLWPRSVWAKLTPQAPDVAAVARAAEEAGAHCLVVANTWLGAEVDLEAGAPVFKRVVAGLSGPALLPLTLRLLFQLYPKVSVPLVACGGICSPQDALKAIMAGASAVQVGTQLFRDPGCCGEILEGIRSFLDSRGLSVSRLVGCAHRASR
jgi:dihydroorotate dehydrogenase (NAD+) catalytic subunit